MLSRRILRIKAFKVLYGYAVAGKMTIDDAMAELDKSCEATRDLYLFMLAIIPALTAEAKQRIEFAKAKFNPTEEERNPNTRFADNAIAPILANDVDFNKLLTRKGLSWEPYFLIVQGILDSAKEKDYFRKYMAAPEASIKADSKLFKRMYEEEFVDNESLAAMLEDKSIYWIDDLAYSLTWCCRTLDSLAEGIPWKLPELYQSDTALKPGKVANVQSDRAFVHNLLKNAFAGYEGYFKLITESVKDWEADRLNASDTALIALGLAEAETFPEIPVKVTINEYVEISKFYCTPKSSAFINGLLDRLIAKLSEEGKIAKTGAGLA